MNPRSRLRKLFFPGAELVSGNHLRLLQSGADFFPALVSAIDAAQAEIHLETYIFHADASGAIVRDALIRSAQRGVRVSLLLDGVGSRDLPQDWQQALQQAGVSVLLYRPPHAGWLGNPLNLRRLHRKLVVIDARVAFIGGMNIIDDFEPLAFPVPRLDFGIEVRGPLIVEIYRNVRRLWRLVALSQLHAGLGEKPALDPTWPTDGHARAALVVRDNFRHRRDIERAYLAALALAQQNIFIASAYFLPGHRFRRILKKAAARGVRVRLLVQGYTDHPFFQAASRAFYSDLLAAAIEIHEYHASEHHAKVAVVDGHWATVGSSNIDPFSLLLAREANIVCVDREFAGQLQQKLEHAMQHGAVKLDGADWRRRTWFKGMLSWLAYEGVRLMVGVAGFRRW
jgi:cardiolipin synthase A/B